MWVCFSFLLPLIDMDNPHPQWCISADSTDSMRVILDRQMSPQLAAGYLQEHGSPFTWNDPVHLLQRRLQHPACITRLILVRFAHYALDFHTLTTLRPKDYDLRHVNHQIETPVDSITCTVVALPGNAAHCRHSIVQYRHNNITVSYKLNGQQALNGHNLEKITNLPECHGIADYSASSDRKLATNAALGG